MRKLHLLPLAALTVSLSACGGTMNRGLESVHQPVVSRTDFVYDLNDGMGAQASERLAAWFESLDVGYVIVCPWMTPRAMHLTASWFRRPRAVSA